MTKAENNKGLTISYEYDDNSNINKTEYKLNDKTNIMNHNFDSDNNINSILFNNSVVKMNYDRLARGTSKDIINEKGTYTTQYGYKNTETPNKTTTILESIKNGNNETIHYTYNNRGYIETIKNGNELLAKYQYDGLGQLTREDNKEQEKTITYEYDTGGNILNKKEYAYTEGDITTQPTKVIEYIYNNANWKDQLTTYDGKQITYDAIGNPLTYDGNTYTWQNGRELASIQNTEKGLNITYKYTDDGIRTEKTVNGETTTYHLDGEIVIYETKGNDTIYYQYDSNQNLIGFKLNDEQYYYIRNGQNDIIGILDNSLNQVVSYTYDTWGKLISIKDGQGNDVTNNTNHIGYKNPYRYRGYRYDTETGLYYLQSRYYNPEIGRFINQDELTSTGQGLLEHNMYAYCNNNPVNSLDVNGEIAITSVGAAILIFGAATAVISSLPKAIESGKTLVGKIENAIDRKYNSKIYTVYTLREGDKTGPVRYVGRTKNPKTRKSFHETTKPGLTFNKERELLTYSEARGLEQELIIKNHTLNAAWKYANKINGISLRNPNLIPYLQAGLEAGGNILGNMTIDEILNWYNDL